MKDKRLKKKILKFKKSLNKISRTKDLKSCLYVFGFINPKENIFESIDNLIFLSLSFLIKLNLNILFMRPLNN